MSLAGTLLVVCPHSSGFCYVKVKPAAFLHISDENSEYLSSASSLAHSYISGSTRLTRLTSCLIWAGVFYRLFTGLFGVYKDLGEEYAFL